MNTAMDAGYAAVIFALATAIWRVSRKRQRPSKRERAAAARDRIIRESYERPGYIASTDPRLPQGINAHLDDYAALDPQLAPVFAPGWDALRQAIRDEQNGDKQ
jgi:hypothetical protein